MSRGIDLTGRTFHRWTVLAPAPKPPHIAGRDMWWHCRCKCGAVRPVPSDNLRRGKSRSCGCLRLLTKQLQKYARDARKQAVP